MDKKIDFLITKLRHTEVFGHLTETERHKLAEMSVRRSVKKGEIICFQGDICRFVLYIASGALRSVITAPDGREHVVSTWEEGEEFWSHSLLDGDPMPSTLEGIQKATTIYQWPGEPVLELLLGNHTATRALDPSANTANSKTTREYIQPRI